MVNRLFKLAMTSAIAYFTYGQLKTVYVFKLIRWAVIAFFFLVFCRAYYLKDTKPGAGWIETSFHAMGDVVGGITKLI